MFRLIQLSALALAITTCPGGHFCLGSFQGGEGKLHVGWSCSRNCFVIGWGKLTVLAKQELFISVSNWFPGNIFETRNENLESLHLVLSQVIAGWGRGGQYRAVLSQSSEEVGFLQTTGTPKGRGMSQPSPFSCSTGLHPQLDFPESGQTRSAPRKGSLWSVTLLPNSGPSS